MGGFNLYFHGGQCCGIKVIAGFPSYPESSHAFGCKHIAYAVNAANGVRNHDSNGSDVSTEKPFFTDAAPKETIEERFERLIKFCKRRRPKGAIEVTLARSAYYGWSQFDLWEPLLFKHGFTVTVPEFVNSNSGNYIKIYHLVYDAKAEKKAQEQAATAPVPNPFGRTEGAI